MGKAGFKGSGILLCSVILAFLWTAAAVADEQQLLAAIDAQAGSCKAVSQTIYDYKELGQQEFKSSQLLMAELRKLGFTVEGDLKVPGDLVKGGRGQNGLSRGTCRQGAGDRRSRSCWSTTPCPTAMPAGTT